MEQDRLGRKRTPDQNRGLRPLHPILPQEWESRAIRVAMSEDDWSRLEALAREMAPAEPTQARAIGATISHLMHAVPAPEHSPGPLDWMDWERRKTLRLLFPGS